MRGVAFFLPALLVAPTAASTQTPYAAPRPAYVSPSAGYSVGYALNDWRRLRQSSGYSFADYARFLNANPGWPEETKLRRWAEKAMRPGENAGTVLAFFAAEPPETGNGYARLADALSAVGRHADGCFDAECLSRATAGLCFGDGRLQRRLCAERLAATATEQRLPLRGLCPVPECESWLARGVEAPPLGREGDALRRECGDGPCLICQRAT